MSQDHKKVAVLKFQGSRFRDHGLDVDVLPELLAYKRLLQETAKEIWRQHHPKRKRLPKGFHDGITLKFFELQGGSTAVPLFREVRSSQATLPLFDHELDEASVLLEEAIAAAASGDGPPTHLPRSVIPVFEQLGECLRDDEAILISAGNQANGARYDRRTRDIVRSWASRDYSDSIELVGEVRGTDLDGQKFWLRVADGRKIPGRFQAEQESVILQALGNHLSRRLRIVGIGEFSPIDGTLEAITRVEDVEVLPLEAANEPAGTLREEQDAVGEEPIWKQIVRLGETVPAEAWNSLPSDFAQNIDKYLYGTKDRD